MRARGRGARRVPPARPLAVVSPGPHHPGALYLASPTGHKCGRFPARAHRGGLGFPCLGIRTSPSVASAIAALGLLGRLLRRVDGFSRNAPGGNERLGHGFWVSPLGPDTTAGGHSTGQRKRPSKVLPGEPSSLRE